MQCGRPRFDSWVGKIPCRRERLPIPAFLGFPCGSDSKKSACNAGEQGSIPGSGSSPREGDLLPQYSCLETPMDRGDWWATVHGVAKSQTQLSKYPVAEMFTILSVFKSPILYHFLEHLSDIWVKCTRCKEHRAVWCSLYNEDVLKLFIVCNFKGYFPYVVITRY